MSTGWRTSGPGRWWWVAVAVLAAVAGPAAAVGAAPAIAAVPSGRPCAAGEGVTVVVDASRLGGGVRTGCATGAPQNGLDALRAAGFAVRGTARFPGFVCRIDGAPASDPCLDSAPADAYWAYWHSTPGGAWTYSDAGAADRRPPTGSVEGWVFSDAGGTPPSVAPPAPAVVTPPSAAAPDPAPAPPAAVAGRTLVAPSADPGSPAPATPAGPAGPTDPPTVDPAAPTPPSTDPPLAPTGPDPAAVDAAPGTAAPTGGRTSDGAGGDTDEEASLGVGATTPTADAGPTPGGGGPWPAVVGLGLVVAVAVAGVMAARRRRGGSTAPW